MKNNLDTLLRKADRIGDKLADMEMMNGDNAPKDWLNDFAPVNDSYNMAKFKLCAQDANKIITAAKRAAGIEYYHATLKQVNRELEGL